MIFNNPSRFFPLLGRARRRYDWPRRTGGNTDPGGTMAHKAAKQVWFITGAGRGMGVDFAKAALAAGHTVVATGRDTDAVAKAVGKSEGLLIVKLDVTNRTDAEAAARAAVDRFGRIDVLVNNAGNFFAGYFEELTPEQIDRQLGTLLTGAMNVSRAVLPVMRRQRSGHIISISSTAGIVGFPFCSAYAAAKFGLEGWMESLQQEVAPFGITTTIVDRKSTRLNSSHLVISYAVFCLKKKKNIAVEPDQKRTYC